MDWNAADDNDSVFYDVWVGRSMDGNLFFHIPPETVSWDFAKNIFYDEPVAKARMKDGVPFQVFSCWNGAVAMTAEPLVKGEVSFRWPDEKRGECFQGEPQLLCKDFWYKGYGRIAVVPSVNLMYTDEFGRYIKGVRGYVSEFVSGRRGKRPGRDEDADGGAEGGGEGDEEEALEEVVGEVGLEERIGLWKGPPDQVKCVPTFNIQSWRPWNESLPVVDSTFSGH